MSTPILDVKRRQNFSEDLLPRSHKAVTRESNRVTLEQHARTNLKKHFETGAGARYGYAQRRSVISISYLQRTAPGVYSQIRRLKFRGRETNLALYKDVKQALGLGPLQFSNQTRQSVLNPANQRVTATPSRGRLRVRTPTYFASRFRGNKFGQRQAQALERFSELEAVTRQEIADLLRRFRKEYTDIQEPGHPKHSLVARRSRRRRRGS